MNAALIATNPQKAKSPRLRDEFAAYLRMRNYAKATVAAYVNDVLDFVLFTGKRDPRTLGRDEVRAFLTHLAVKRNVSWKTQNQNLCALVRFYDDFLKQPLGKIGEFAAASRPPRLPVVYSRSEVQRVLAAMTGRMKLNAEIQYGCGARVGEAVRVRVKTTPVTARTRRFSASK